MLAILLFGVVAPGSVSVAGETLTGDAGYSATYDSNLFRLPEEMDVEALTGRSERGDLISRGSLSLSLNKPVSGQRFTAEGSVARSAFREYSELDNTAHRLSAAWLWKAGERLSGELGRRIERSLIGFSDFRPGEIVRNLRTTDESRFSLKGRLTSRWSLQAEFEWFDSQNSARERFRSDRREDALRIGVEYRSRAGSLFELIWRTAEGDYPNRLFPDARDNGYRLWQMESIFGWRATEASEFQLRFGERERRYDELDDLAYSGRFGAVRYFYDPGGKSRVSASWKHDRSANEEFSAKYLDIDTLRVAPVWKPTHKLEVGGVIEYIARDFASSPDFEGREDQIHATCFNVTYRPTRSSQVRFGVRDESRNSTLGAMSYHDRGVSFGVEVGF